LEKDGGRSCENYIIDIKKEISRGVAMMKKEREVSSTSSAQERGRVRYAGGGVATTNAVRSDNYQPTSRDKEAGEEHARNMRAAARMRASRSDTGTDSIFRNEIFR
jgi:hypothetical protein